VRNLLEGSLHDERHRQIDANIGWRWPVLKNLAPALQKKPYIITRYAES